MIKKSFACGTLSPSSPSPSSLRSATSPKGERQDALSVLASLGHLSQRERQDALSVLASLGHLSQRERQAPWLSPLALPLGELSPKVTERARAVTEGD